MTIFELLSEGKKQLSSQCSTAVIDTPALDAELLLAEILHMGRTKLLTHSDSHVTDVDRENFFRLLGRRREGECVAYILGRREFRGLEFTVNPFVLVPRPDTEIMVEAALGYIDTTRRIPSGEKDRDLSLLDLCTGSGAVAVSLKNERPFLDVSASDISEEALSIAAGNAEKLLDKRSAIRFIRSDLFERIPGMFHIIVSNPPYVSKAELSALAPEIKREPAIALNGGEDGLELIKKIVSIAHNYLFPGGLLMLEADPGQMPAIRILLESNYFTDIRIYKDLSARERVISGQLRLPG